MGAIVLVAVGQVIPTSSGHNQGWASASGAPRGYGQGLQQAAISPKSLTELKLTLSCHAHSHGHPIPRPGDEGPRPSLAGGWRPSSVSGHGGFATVQLRRSTGLPSE